MAITVNYAPSIEAAGQIASGYGQYLGNQQAFQNNLAIAKLRQQNTQFYDNLRFREGAMRFQDRSQRQQAEAQRDYGREMKMIDVGERAVGRVSQRLAQREQNMFNLARADQQNQFAAAQDNVRHNQNIELFQLRTDAANENRDAAFKQRKELATFEDELTRERYTFQYDEQQRRKMEEYRRAMAHVDTLEGFNNQFEKDWAKKRIAAKMMGIQPMPRLEDPSLFPDGKGIFDTWVEQDPFGRWHQYTRNSRGDVEELSVSTPPPTVSSLPNGSIVSQSVDASGRATTHTLFDIQDSEFSQKAKAERSKEARDRIYGLGDYAALYDDPVTGIEGIFGKRKKKEELDKEYEKWKLGEAEREDAFLEGMRNALIQERQAKIETDRDEIVSLRGEQGDAAADFPQVDGRLQPMFEAMQQQQDFPQQVARDVLQSPTRMRKLMAAEIDALDQMGVPKVTDQMGYDAIPEGSAYIDLTDGGMIKVKGQEPANRKPRVSMPNKPDFKQYNMWERNAQEIKERL